jgi:hypothetical protein
MTQLIISSIANMNLYELGKSHGSYVSGIDKDWEALCLASQNNRNAILRRLSITQTGDAGSYRTGWIDHFMIDTGKSQAQAISAYSRFVSKKIDKFAPPPSVRAKRTAAEMEDLPMLS